MIQLLEKGDLKPDSVNDMGQTPLMVAVDASFSHQTIAKCVELGCKVNAQNTSDGMTALQGALALENELIFEELLKAGADADLKDNDGDSVKSECEQGSYASFKALLGKYNK